MLRCRADGLRSLHERSTADATRLRKRPISRRGKRVKTLYALVRRPFVLSSNILCTISSNVLDFSRVAVHFVFYQSRVGHKVSQRLRVTSYRSKSDSKRSLAAVYSRLSA